MLYTNINNSAIFVSFQRDMVKCYLFGSNTIDSSEKYISENEMVFKFQMDKI